MGKTTGLEKDLSKAEKKVRRLYALVWLLACPLIFVVVYLLGFRQINIVYWTLLAVPLLLGAYNVHQVPPARKKPHTVHGVPAPQSAPDVAAGSASGGASGGASGSASGSASGGASGGATGGTPSDSLPPESAAQPEGISHVQRARYLAIALRIPVVIAVPILATLIVDLILRLQK